jgi:hypothetical protein
MHFVSSLFACKQAAFMVAKSYDMKKLVFHLFVIFSFCSTAQGQDSTAIKHKVAIFAPLYLDSAFDANNEYRYEKNVFPKFINPGLEFYEGAKLALDSLGKENANLEVFIYDTRSSRESLEKQLEKINDVELIIAYCSPNELRPFGEFGQREKIPVINVNVANDGGVAANPFFVILNSTLKTQCEGIYRYIQKYYATKSLVIFRKKGALEDRLRSYFDDFSKSTVSVPLKLKYVDLPDSFTTNQLKAHLDDSRETICIAGSLDEYFGKRLTQYLAVLKKDFAVTVMGMPTWDAIKDFNRPEYKGIEILYSTPFYNARTDKVSAGVINYFSNAMYARPSDMVFRGYEVTWKYSKLLLQYKSDLASNLGNKQYNVFNDFDIQPIINKSNMTLDYFENKRLYFLKWQDGVIRSVNW